MTEDTSLTTFVNSKNAEVVEQWRHAEHFCLVIRTPHCYNGYVQMYRESGEYPHYDELNQQLHEQQKTELPELTYSNPRGGVGFDTAHYNDLCVGDDGRPFGMGQMWGLGPEKAKEDDAINVWTPEKVIATTELLAEWLRDEGL